MTRMLSFLKVILLEVPFNFAFCVSQWYSLSTLFTPQDAELSNVFALLIEFKIFLNSHLNFQIHLQFSKTIVLTYIDISLIDVLLNSKVAFFKKRLWPHYGLQVALRVWAAALILGGEFIILPTAARHSSNFKQKRTLQNRHAKFPKLARFSKILLICLVLVLRGWLATSN